MDEASLRDILLVRAIESTAAGNPVFGDEDRRHAGRAAAELARWDATERRRAPDPAAFLARRARLLVERLPQRAPALLQAAQGLRWRGSFGALLLVLAPLAGAGFEQLGGRHRVDLLAFPLLALVGWNLAVIAAVLLAMLLKPLGWLRATAPTAPDAATGTGPRAWLLAWARRRAGPRRGALRPGTAQGEALVRFAADWLRSTAPVARAQAGALLHAAAALFAAGAVAGLYLRGLVLEFRAGWESTFLDPAAVHALLATVLAPAARLLGTVPPGLEEVAALQWAADGAGGGPAARWIHLYAVTVGLAAVLPRALLAGLEFALARHRRRHLELDLAEPYFARLLAGFGAGPARLRVVPYAYTPDETSVAGLRALAAALLGEEAELVVRPPVAFGSEEVAAAGLAADPQVALTLGVFSLAATPETENHGAFVERLRADPAAARLALLVDAAPYRRRLGGLAEAGARLAERGEAWRAFGAAHGLPVVTLDLEAPAAEALGRCAEVLAAIAGPRR